MARKTPQKIYKRVANVTPPTRVHTNSPSGSRTRDSGAGGERSNKDRQRLQPLASVARAPIFEVRGVRFTHSPYWHTSVTPAVLTYKKAICKSLLDELRRTGKSPTDMANQVMEMMHLKYEHAHLAYLLSCQNILDAEAGRYGQKSITGFLRKKTQPETQPALFGEYDDHSGWNLTDCLLYEYQRQEGAIKKLLQGTFGQAFRSDHTRKVARKVTFTSGTMSSYAIMNETWMIISWAMVQSETDKSLEPMYRGLANRYRMAEVEKAHCQLVDRYAMGHCGDYITVE